jgi:hypothetical protein
MENWLLVLSRGIYHDFGSIIDIVIGIVIGIVVDFITSSVAMRPMRIVCGRADRDVLHIARIAWGKVANIDLDGTGAVGGTIDLDGGVKLTVLTKCGSFHSGGISLTQYAPREKGGRNEAAKQSCRESQNVAHESLTVEICGSSVTENFAMQSAFDAIHTTIFEVDGSRKISVRNGARN